MIIFPPHIINCIRATLEGVSIPRISYDILFKAFVSGIANLPDQNAYINLPDQNGIRNMWQIVVIFNMRHSMWFFFISLFYWLSITVVSLDNGAGSPNTDFSATYINVSLTSYVASGPRGPFCLINKCIINKCPKNHHGLFCLSPPSSLLYITKRHICKFQLS